MFDYDKMRALLIGEGMDEKVVAAFIREMREDAEGFHVGRVESEWALRRGFFPGRIPLYGLTEANVDQFVSDYAYYMMHPLNNHFRIWVNDKLTLKYMLDSGEFRSLMPEYYLYIENDGAYTYLMDSPDELLGCPDFLDRLLKEKGALALKPNNGAGGRGFIKLELRDGAIIENNKPLHGDLDSLIRSLRNYTVTSYEHQHRSLSDFWPSSECTLRIIMVKLPKDSCYCEDRWSCITSYARFGSNLSGGASNLSSGGIGVGFDFESGEFSQIGYRYMKYSSDGRYSCEAHPDTEKAWTGFSLPNWDYTRKAIERACRRMDSLSYLGFDVIITDDGAKLCEINTLPSMNYEQVICGPVLADSSARSFFESKGLCDINCGRFFEMYCECRS